jgi:hypothetical protein
MGGGCDPGSPEGLLAGCGVNGGGTGGAVVDEPSIWGFGDNEPADGWGSVPEDSGGVLSKGNTGAVEVCIVGCGCSGWRSSPRG